jgi:ABC-type sugar transport system permease subunit
MSNGARGTDNSVVVGGGLGGALAVLISYFSKQLFGVELPPEVASAMAVVLIAICGWIASKL